MSEHFTSSVTPTSLINPTEQHIACVLLVDTSESMTGDTIKEVNDSIHNFADTVLSDSMVKCIVDVCVIEFNDTANVICPFTPISQFDVPTFRAGGCSAMNEAILLAFKQLDQRKKLYRDLCVSYYRPWMFLLTNSRPTDGERSSEAKDRLKEELERKRILFIQLALNGADNAALASYPCTGVVKFSTNAFRSMFEWLGQVPIYTCGNRCDTDSLTLPPLPDVVIDIF